MSETAPTNTTPRRSRRYWEGVSAIIAALIGLLALSVSAYTAHIQWLQVSAQVWPNLLLTRGRAEHKLILFNKGTGPAIIRSVRISIDGKPLRDWDAVAAASKTELKGGEGFAFGNSTINGITLSAGERYDYLVVTGDKKFSADGKELSADEKELAAEKSFERILPILKKVDMRICYCSVLQQCWVLDSRNQSSNIQAAQVDRCERKEDEELRD